MVDFNTETTLSRNASDIVKILVLEKREDCFLALKGLKKLIFIGGDPSEADFRARLVVFYEEIRSMFIRKKGDDRELEQLLRGNINDLIIAFRILNSFLDEVNLTKLDTRQKYDATNIELENELKGL
jgi:hypothetical protein